MNPDWISWHGYSPRGSVFTGKLMTVPFDGCVFDDNTIVLAEGFRNELKPEDWGPLIASELIYVDRFRKRLWRGLLPRLAIPSILLLLACFFLSGVVAFFTPYTLASILLVVLSYNILGLPLAKKPRLMADKEAVQVTGTEQFLSALTKVGKLIPKLMVGKRPDSHYPLDRPSIKRRMEAIQPTGFQSS